MDSRHGRARFRLSVRTTTAYPLARALNNGERGRLRETLAWLRETTLSQAEYVARSKDVFYLTVEADTAELAEQRTRHIARELRVAIGSVMPRSGTPSPVWEQVMPATATRGGRREGSGRKPTDPSGAGVDRAFRLFPRHLALIAAWQAEHGVNASEAVRQMIERASR